MLKEQCDILESLIDADENNGVVSDLKHIIYNLAEDTIDQMISDYNVFRIAMHDYERPYGTLLDYQTLAVCFMYYAQKCILGDSVGMGKTVATAGVFNLIKREMAKTGQKHRYLVLTQKNLAVQFRRELVKFTGEFVELIPSGEAKQVQLYYNTYDYREKPEFSVVGTHALLMTKSFIQWLELCRTEGEGFPFDTLVVDESSELGTGQMASVFKALSGYFKNIYFLNATPFETHLGIFYNQLSLLDPKLLPTKQNFTKEYCIMDYRGMYPKPSGRYKNQENFKRLIRYRYFARTRRDKGAEMRECDGRVVLSPLSSVQKDLLKRSQLHKIVFDCPSHIDDSIPFNSSTVPKLASLSGLLDNECAEADTIIIFVYHKEAQSRLSEWLTSMGHSNRVLNGETPNNKRISIIEGFRNREYRILLTNVQKGLNFGNCDYCIFYSYDTNPSSMVQFEGRITRDFDIVGKHIYILCSMGEEYRNLMTVVKERVKATKDFTNTDYSVVLDIIAGGSKNGNNAGETKGDGE